MTGRRGAWRWSPWGVAPDAIPGADVDPQAVRIAAAGLAGGGREVRDVGADVHRTWRGLAAHYEAPEAPTLLAAMEPVERDAREVGDAVEAVAAALRRYADDVEPVVGRLALLRHEAHRFDDVVRRVPDWRADPGLVARARRIRGDVEAAVAALEEAERRCAAAIRAACTVPPVCGPVVEPGAAAAGAWGPSSGGREGCARSAAGNARSYLDGFIGDGIVGGWLATASLGGLTPHGFDREVLQAAWGGMADLAVPGSVTWLIRRPDAGTTRDAWTNAAKGLVAADQWRENPARGAGAVTFGVASAFLPGGGVKSAASGVGAAAKAAGRAARVADDVAEGAGRPATSWSAGGRLSERRPVREFEWEAWAGDVYDGLRDSPGVADEIVMRNPGLTAGEVRTALKHVLEDEHLLGGGVYGPLYRDRFAPDADMAEAFLRLREGKATEADVVLIKHESAEAKYVLENPEATYREAHQHANTVANWEELVRRARGAE